MKLTTITHVSVDGVMQGLGGQDEDRRGGFERGAELIGRGDVTPSDVFLRRVGKQADSAGVAGRRDRVCQRAGGDP